MKNTHTVDVSAKSSVPSAQKGLKSRSETSRLNAPLPNDYRADNYRAAARQSLVIDAVWILISLLFGALFSIVIGTLNESVDVSQVPLLPAQWFLILACSTPALLWSFVDMLSLLSNPAALPFARSQSKRQAIYFQRAHTLLVAFYFAAILVALCWSAVAMPLTSKLFVSAIFSFALYALGRSIPSQRTSFVVSGVLFLVVLVVTQLFIVMRLEADAGAANQRALDELLIDSDRSRDDVFQ